MQTFISCAKTMTEKAANAPFSLTEPQFLPQAREIALRCASLSADELGRLLRVNPQLAALNYLRYQHFYDDTVSVLPALLSYTGMVFKHISPTDFTPQDWSYAQEHLLITSFLYGLLRPADAIRNYRMEGNVRLPDMDGQTLFAYWRGILTDFLISRVQAQGGVLVNLASAEMKELFDWKRVTDTVRVITPEFRQLHAGRMRTVVIYTKMCRGEMVRYIVRHRLSDPESLKDFEWEGYRFQPSSSHGDDWFFVCQV